MECNGQIKDYEGFDKRKFWFTGQEKRTRAAANSRRTIDRDDPGTDADADIDEQSNCGSSTARSLSAEQEFEQARDDMWAGVFAGDNAEEEEEVDEDHDE